MPQHDYIKSIIIKEFNVHVAKNPSTHTYVIKKKKKKKEWMGIFQKGKDGGEVGLKSKPRTDAGDSFFTGVGEKVRAR